MEQYTNLFLPAINVNICDTLEANIEIFSEEVRKAMDLGACKTVYEGVMKKGIFLEKKLNYRINNDSHNAV